MMPKWLLTMMRRLPEAKTLVQVASILLLLLHQILIKKTAKNHFSTKSLIFNTNSNITVQNIKYAIPNTKKVGHTPP